MLYLVYLSNLFIAIKTITCPCNSMIQTIPGCIIKDQTTFEGYCDGDLCYRSINRQNDYTTSGCLITSTTETLDGCEQWSSVKSHCVCNTEDDCTPSNKNLTVSTAPMTCLFGSSKDDKLETCESARCNIMWRTTDFNNLKDHRITEMSYDCTGDVLHELGLAIFPLHDLCMMMTGGFNKEGFCTCKENSDCFNRIARVKEDQFVVECYEQRGTNTETMFCKGKVCYKKMSMFGDEVSERGCLYVFGVESDGIIAHLARESEEERPAYEFCTQDYCNGDD